MNVKAKAPGVPPAPIAAVEPGAPVMVPATVTVAAAPVGPMRR